MPNKSYMGVSKNLKDMTNFKNLTNKTLRYIELRVHDTLNQNVLVNFIHLVSKRISIIMSMYSLKILLVPIFFCSIATYSQTYTSKSTKNIDGSFTTKTKKENDPNKGAYANPKAYGVDYSVLNPSNSNSSTDTYYQMGVAMGKASAERKRKEELERRESARIYVDEDTLLKSSNNYSTIVIEKVKGTSSNKVFNEIIDTLVYYNKYKVLETSNKYKFGITDLDKNSPKKEKYLYLTWFIKSEGIHQLTYVRVDDYLGNPVYKARGKNVPARILLKPLISNQEWSYDFFLTKEEMELKNKEEEQEEIQLHINKTQARKELLELNELFKEGLLTEKEFNAKKEELKKIILE